MSPPSWQSSIASFCVKWTAKAAVGTTSGAIAALSVAETLAGLIDSHLATDIRAIKENLHRRLEAGTQIVEAEAAKRLSEAAEAANRATVHKRRDRLAEAEKKAVELANAKTQAEIDAIHSDAECRRVQAVADATAKLTEVLSRVRQDGGGTTLDSDNLKQIIDDAKRRLK